MNKILKRIPLSLALVAVALSMTACQDEYEDLFLNPEQSTTAKVEYLFTEQQLASDLNLDYWETYYLIYGDVARWTQISGTVNDEHMMEPSSVRWGATWEKYYTRMLMLYKEMQTLYDAMPAEEKQGYDAYLQAAKILNAYNTAYISDLWGDMPYSEAGTARNAAGANYFPKYDAQKDIYTSILKDLKDASDALKTLTAPSTMATQDLFMKGNLLKWQKFANSLRLRLALRIADVDAATAQAVVREILTGNYPLVETNAENIAWPNSTEHNSWGDMGRSTRELPDETYAPKYMLDMMLADNDPRVQVYFDPNLGGQYVGIPSSPDAQKAAGDADRQKYARVDSLFLDQNYDLPQFHMTAAEVAFLKAEAAARGWYSGDAAQLYNTALRLSVEQYYQAYNANKQADDLAMPTTAEVDALLAGAPYQGLQSIGTQKWIHFFLLQPYEAWNTVRQFDLPFGADVSGGRTLARTVRVTYPSTEQSNNVPGYSAVKDKDLATNRVWWDVR